MNKLWWIDSADLQAHVPVDEQHKLLQMMHATRYEAGKAIYACSLPGDVIYLIQQGRVALYQNTPAQTRRELASLGRGDMFGTMSLVEDGYKAGCAVCTEPAVIQVLRKSGLEQLMKHFPATGAMLVEFLQENLTAQAKERNRHSVKNVYRRLCRLLLHFLDHPAYLVADKPIRMREDPRELASLLGARPDVIETCLERLEKAGIIARHHHELRLKDRKRLEMEAV